MHKRIALKKY